MFTRKRSWNSETPLVFRGTVIPFSEQTRYLGVTMDTRLSWSHHCKQQAKKAKSLLMMCRRAVGKTWGLSPKCMHWLYTSVIRPILFYGALVWAPAIGSKMNMNALNRVQRMAMVMISSAFPGTPTAALEMLLNIHPMDIAIKAEAAKTMHRLVQQDGWNSKSETVSIGKTSTHVTICWHTAGEIPHLRMPCDYMTPSYDFEQKYSIEILPREEFHADIVEYAGDPIRCYTDGSRMNDISGCGFTIQIKGEKDVNVSIPLGNHATVFQAEAHAIKCAASTLIRDKTDNKIILILSDSQAVLKSLENPRCNKQSILECKEMLNQLSLCNEVKLRWVPGHAGHDGNELADELARQGSLSKFCGPEPVLPVSMRTCKLAVSRWADGEMERKWIARNDCRISRLNIYRTSKSQAKRFLGLCRWSLRGVIQVITGHGNIGKHRHIMGMANSPTCQMCLSGDDETVEHFVCDCPRYRQTRINIFDEEPTSIRLIVRQNQLGKLARYIKKTKRLELF